MNIKRTERGWCAHFIGGWHCLFRRNTLLECEDVQIVVSTVGGYRPHDRVEAIGHERWYETMAFIAEEHDGYIEADVTKEIDFESEWEIWGNTFDEVIAKHPNVDNAANDMHENVVKEITTKLQNGERPNDSGEWTEYKDEDMKVYALINWNWCNDPNDINEAIKSRDENWEGLTSTEQIISISYDARHGNYVVFWRIDKD